MHDKNNVDLEFLKLQYQVLSNRQISQRSMVWAAPSLFFVAITFLWDIALNENTNPAISCLVSFIAVLIAFASLHNFIRNRVVEIADCEQLIAIERLIKAKEDVYCPVMIVHHELSERTLIDSSGKDIGKVKEILKEHPLYKYPISHWQTFNVWKVLLALMLLITIVFFIYNLYDMINLYI